MIIAVNDAGHKLVGPVRVEPGTDSFDAGQALRARPSFEPAVTVKLRLPAGRLPLQIIVELAEAFEPARDVIDPAQLGYRIDDGERH